MAELEIDQSNLPRVQEVCQNFAVLEDSVLAHSLQEQEIEHYYTTNIQKNQLVQNDIRMAKRLQDEEDERRKQQSSLLRQASRQIEEQDCEYARVIQEELQLCADEAHRREREDEEIAKQIQEEEEWRGRSSSRARESFSDDDAGGPSSPSSHQHTLSSMQRGERLHQPSAATRGHCSPSHTQSDLSEPEAPRGPVARKHTTPLSNEGHRVCVRRISDKSLECSSEDSETSDSVFYERSHIGSRGSFKRADTAPCRRRVSLSEPRQKHYRSLHSHCSFREERSVRKEERGEWNEHPEYDPPEDRRGRDHGEERDDRRRNGERWRGPRPEEAGGQRRRCSESVRLHDRDRRRDGDLARTWSSREIPDKHVHFRDQRQGYHDDGNIGIWEMLGRVLRERGIAVRHGAPPPPVPPQGPHGVQSRPSQPLHLHRSEASYRDSQPPLRGFQRSALARHSYHGNARQPRSPAHKATSEVCEEPGGESGGGSRRWQRGELKPEARSSGGDYEREDGGHSRCECRVSRSRSESWHWRKREEEELSLEEQEEQQQQQQEEEEEQESRRRRVLRRSQSLRGRRVSGRVLSRDVSTGSTLSPQPRGAGLDLAELQQVLQDEELARRLQEEEDRRVRRPIEESSRPPHPRRSSPQAGDFRVAQVAQDEEIARFMQKQEIKSKRRSRELEGPSSWREHREMISHHDRRAARERQGQRERLDSEGLPSPTEDYSPENEPPSPISTITQAQQIRNIAEELDPTFKARRRDKSGLRTGQSGPACPSLSVPQPSAQDPLEEPAFIPPTKRQGDKPGRTKPKEKKENCKQQ